MIWLSSRIVSVASNKRTSTSYLRSASGLLPVSALNAVLDHHSIAFARRSRRICSTASASSAMRGWLWSSVKRFRQQASKYILTVSSMQLAAGLPIFLPTRCASSQCSHSARSGRIARRDAVNRQKPKHPKSRALSERTPRFPPPLRASALNSQHPPFSVSPLYAVAVSDSRSLRFLPPACPR
jgi:hypothetical protein